MYDFSKYVLNLVFADITIITNNSSMLDTNPVVKKVSLVTISPVSNHQKENSKYIAGSTMINVIKKIVPHIINLFIIDFKFYFYIITINSFI
jgi:hypothetical protein